MQSTRSQAVERDLVPAPTLVRRELGHGLVPGTLGVAPGLVGLRLAHGKEPVSGDLGDLHLSGVETVLEGDGGGPVELGAAGGAELA